MYYGKGIRTLEDIENLNQLIENRADDFLRLMVLEEFTDFYTVLKGWNPKDSLCNMIYILQKAQDNADNKKTITPEDFLDYANKVFGNCKFKQSDEVVVENAITAFVKLSNKN